MSNPNIKPRPDLLKPWRKGENHPRISKAAATAVKLARKHCPSAIIFAARVMNDEMAGLAHRLKAADLILTHGMPKGDNSKYLGEETIGAITLNLVMPKMDDDKPTIDGQSLTVYTPTQGTGD